MVGVGVGVSAAAKGVTVGCWAAQPINKIQVIVNKLMGFIIKKVLSAKLKVLNIEANRIALGTFNLTLTIKAAQ